jgi:hypothetical protein
MVSCGLVVFGEAIEEKEKASLPKGEKKNRFEISLKLPKLRVFLCQEGIL